MNKALRSVPTVFEFRGRQLIIWEEMDRKFMRACLAEFMAMHLFVLFCCGCAMATLHFPNPNLMMIAASFGFGILVLAQIFGPLSGGHINCAVSFGLFIAGRTSLIKTLCYTLSQMAGSIFGALFLWAIFGPNWTSVGGEKMYFGSNAYSPSDFTGAQVFFAEMLGTMVLMFNVLSTIDIPKEGGGPLGVYPIAMSVMIAHLFLLPIDGCSINPTRSFGPAVVAGWAGLKGNYTNQQYVFWLGPLFGAGVAAVLYEYGSLKPENFAGAKDMDTTLFQAGKRKHQKHRKHHEGHEHDMPPPPGVPEVENPMHFSSQQQQPPQVPIFPQQDSAVGGSRHPASALTAAASGNASAGFDRSSFGKTNPLATASSVNSQNANPSTNNNNSVPIVNPKRNNKYEDFDEEDLSGPPTTY